MARARNIKPGFFANEELVELPFATRLLFIGLWTLADREGRLEDKPKRIKMNLFPADDINVDEALCQLEASGFLARYEVAGAKYIQVLAFRKHQNPHKDEKASLIPAPGEHGASTVQAPESHDSNPADSLIPDSLIPESGSQDDDTGDSPVAVGVSSAEPEIDMPPADDFGAPKSAPLPMREQPPLSEDPAVQMTVKLRRLGVNVMSTNPHLIAWVAAGVTDALLAEAVALAREHKGTAAIAPGYLVPIIDKLRNPAPARAPTARTAPPLNEKFHFNHLDRSGDARAMEESMRRHGITVPDDGEEIEI